MKLILYGLALTLPYFALIAIGLRVNPMDYSYKKGVESLKEGAVSGVTSNYLEFKLGLLKETKPNIIAVGSSRAMQFRSFMFNDKFTSAGYAIHSLNDLYSFFNTITSEKEYSNIKSFLIVIDPEWLNLNYQKFSAHLQKDSKKNKTQLRKLKELVKKYRRSIKKTVKIFLNLSNPMFLSYFSKDYNPYWDGRINGRFGSGFRLDGSYLYYSLFYNLRKNSDYNFKDTLKRIKDRNKRFQAGDDLNTDGMKFLTDLKSRLINMNKNVVFILPPFANRVYKEIEINKHDYSYIYKLKNSKLIDFDFSNPSSFGGDDDCEFIDGMHGSEVTFGRIVHNLAKNTKLKNDFKINTEKLAQLLKFRRGRILFNPETPVINYVKDGCNL